MNSSRYKSIVNLDLGAKCTGVFLVNHKAGVLPNSGNCKATTLVMPEESNGLTYSTKNRTAVRHRLRGKKRFALARRLLMLIVKQKFKEQEIEIDKDKDQKIIEALSGLLKRRGYSRLETETDLTTLESLDVSVFANHEVLGNYFHEKAVDNGRSLVEQWEDLSQDLSRVNAFSKASLPSEKEFRSYLKEEYPELTSQEKNYLQGLKTLKEDASNLINQETLGQRHRKVYLQEIYADMQHDTRLIPVVTVFGGIDRLWRLVGNISNLQLRAERWYFNAPHMRVDDFFDADRLQKTLVRAFKYFHPSKEQSEDLSNLIKELSESKDIVDTLCSIDPERTIPPYEDQNNRRPPIDQTLLLSPSSLNKRFSDKWLIWANNFAKWDNELEDDLDEIIALTDRKSRVVALGGKPFDSRVYAASYILQRVLDRTRLRDPFSLRAIAGGSKGRGVEIGLENLRRVLGSQHIDAFLSFAKDYYDEVNNAQMGLWLNTPDTLLERSDLHPPMKKKILNTLVGNVFGESEDFGHKFITEIWTMQVSNRRSTVKSICQAIETVRKDFGGEFNIAYQNALNNRKQGNSQKEDKELLLIADRIAILIQFFKEKLNFSDITVNRAANPYSLAQLYTLIETERKGFTSNTKAVHLENAWRMKHGQDVFKGVQCSRLPADSVRPFDGVLRKLLDRQAWEITKLASAEIKRNVTEKNAVIDVAVIVEQNRFAFSASIAEIKKNRRAQQKAGRLADLQEKRWANKDIRIQEASLGLCPYTGENLNTKDAGEIDHIIPRSKTTLEMGTVFNSEANLIFVSRKGNQHKKDTLYFLEDLNKQYLLKRFGTANIQEIEERIEKEVALLAKNNRIGKFELLNEQEQAYVRHALFLRSSSDARQHVIREIASHNRTRVNGTQAWLIRSFIEKMQQECRSWCQKNGNKLNFKAWATDVAVSSDIRKKLGEYDNALKKVQPQPVISHSIDALCSYAAACGIDRINAYLQGDPQLGDTEVIERVRELYPDASDIVRVQSLDLIDKDNFSSRPIFKEGILAEHFVPVMIHKGVIRIGYTLPSKDGNAGNSIEVKGKDPKAFISLIEPYLDRPVDYLTDKCETYKVNKIKAFELFSNINLREASEEELIAADVLESLYFITERKKVISQIYDKDGKTLLDKSQIVNDKNFEINLKEPRKTSSQFKFTGKLILPVKKDWENLCDHPKIKPFLGKKTEGVDLYSVISDIFRMNSGKRKHTAVKRDPSLPICSTASGLFRIQRKAYNGTPVFQTHNIAGAKYKGFVVKKGKLDWSRPVMFSQLRTKNVTAIKERYEPETEFFAMNQWRLVKKGDVKVHMSPGSEGRRYIRVDVPFSIFKEWYEASAPNKTLSSIFALSSDIKVDGNRFRQAVGKELHELLGSPRSNLFIEHLGERVVFRYIVVNSNNQMNDAFNNSQD